MNKFRLSKTYFFVSFIFLLFNIVNANDGKGQAGTESLFSFGFGARAMGMGHAFSAIANDATAVYWNPAGLDRVYQQSVTVFHASLLEDAIYDFLGYAYPTLDLGTFGLGIARVGVGNIQMRNEFGEKTTLSSYDAYRMFMSYGLDLPYDLAAGASLKIDRAAFYELQNENTRADMGIGFDLGLMYRPTIFSASFLQDWSLGLNIQNLFAPQIKLGDVADVLPLTFRFGIARKLRFMGPGNALNIALDLGKSEYTDMSFSFGTEYTFQDLGMVRLGYDGSALAFGAGVKYSMFQIDYAFGNPSTDGLLDPIHRISLSFDFGLNRDEMFEITEEIRKREEERIISDIREADKQKFIAEHLQKAENYFGSEQYLDAIGEYQAVINADPFHQRAKIMLDSSNVLLENQFDQRQLAAVRTAVDKVTAEENQKFIDERFERGRLYLDKKQFTKALIEFNLALERDAENQTILGAIQTTRRRQSEELGSLIRKGRQELQNENYSEALRLFSEAQLLSPDDPNVLKEVGTLVERTKIQENIQKGLMLYDIGEFNEALDIFGQILETDPKNEFIKQYYDRSKIETLDSSGDMAPEAKRKYLEGVDKFLLGKYQEAIAIWEQILEKDPYNKKVLEAVNGAKERVKRAQSEEQ